MLFCHIHVVLATLYQEEMVTKQEMEEMKLVEVVWSCLARIQCTKPPDVVTRTTKLLVMVRQHEAKDLLKGQ